MNKSKKLIDLDNNIESLKNKNSNNLVEGFFGLFQNKKSLKEGFYIEDHLLSPSELQGKNYTMELYSIKYNAHFDQDSINFSLGNDVWRFLYVESSKKYYYENPDADNPQQAAQRSIRDDRYMYIYNDEYGSIMCEFKNGNRRMWGPNQLIPQITTTYTHPVFTTSKTNELNGMPMYPVQIPNESDLRSLPRLFNNATDATTPNCKTFIPLPDFAHIENLYEDNVLTIVDIDKLNDMQELSSDQEVKYEYELTDGEKKDLYALTHNYHVKASPIINDIPNSIKYSQQSYEQLLQNTTFTSGLVQCHHDTGAQPIKYLSVELFSTQLPGWFNNVLFISKSGHLFSFKFFKDCNSCTTGSSQLKNTLNQIPKDATTDINNLAHDPHFKRYKFPIFNFRTENVFQDLQVFDNWSIEHADIDGWKSTGDNTSEFRYTSKFIPNRHFLRTLDISSDIIDESIFYFATDKSLFKYSYVQLDGYGSFQSDGSHLNSNVKLAKWWEPVNERYGIICNSKYVGCFKDNWERMGGWMEMHGNVPGDTTLGMMKCEQHAKDKHRDGYALQYNNQCFLLKEGATMFEFESQLNSTELRGLKKTYHSAPENIPPGETASDRAFQAISDRTGKYGCQQDINGYWYGGPWANAIYRVGRTQGCDLNNVRLVLTDSGSGSSTNSASLAGSEDQQDDSTYIGLYIELTDNNGHILPKQWICNLTKMYNLKSENLTKNCEWLNGSSTFPKATHVDVISYNDWLAMGETFVSKNGKLLCYLDPFNCLRVAANFNQHQSNNNITQNMSILNQAYQSTINKDPPELNSQYRSFLYKDSNIAGGPTSIIASTDEYSRLYKLYKLIQPDPPLATENPIIYGNRDGGYHTSLNNFAKAKTPSQYLHIDKIMYTNNSESQIGEKIIGRTAKQCLNECDNKINCKYVQYIPKPTTVEEKKIEKTNEIIAITNNNKTIPQSLYQNFPGKLGIKFKVKNKPIFVTSLGCFNLNATLHRNTTLQVFIADASTGSHLTEASVISAQEPPDYRINNYLYRNLSNPVKLEVGKSYFIVVQGYNDNDNNINMRGNPNTYIRANSEHIEFLESWWGEKNDHNLTHRDGQPTIRYLAGTFKFITEEIDDEATKNMCFLHNNNVEKLVELENYAVPDSPTPPRQAVYMKLLQPPLTPSGKLINAGFKNVDGRIEYNPVHDHPDHADWLGANAYFIKPANWSHINNNLGASFESYNGTQAASANCSVNIPLCATNEQQNQLIEQQNVVCRTGENVSLVNSATGNSLTSISNNITADRQNATLTGSINSSPMDQPESFTNINTNYNVPNSNINLEKYKFNKFFENQDDFIKSFLVTFILIMIIIIFFKLYKKR